jgi:hypothetical protein
MYGAVPDGGPGFCQQSHRSIAKPLHWLWELLERMFENEAITLMKKEKETVPPKGQG